VARRLAKAADVASSDEDQEALENLAGELRASSSKARDGHAILERAGVGVAEAVVVATDGDNSKSHRQIAQNTSASLRRRSRLDPRAEFFAQQVCARLPDLDRDRRPHRPVHLLRASPKSDRLMTRSSPRRQVGANVARSLIRSATRRR